MALSYLGEIRMFAGNFAPAGWMFCEGQLLPISGNQALYALLGNRYGGDRVSTFALPDLRGRVPLHQGNGLLLAELGGTEEVTLNWSQVPAHTHALSASGYLGNVASPENNVLSRSPIAPVYHEGGALVNLAAQAIISPGGGGQPHANFQPYLCINFIISLAGYVPEPA
jgi:microcystin-dependent protein